MSGIIPVGVPKIIQRNWSNLTWNIDTKAPTLYLTFDDGPTPEITTWVLDCLKSFNAKATFFCIGKNVASHPAIYNRILEESHGIGNHTFSHLKAWNSKSTAYIENITLAQATLERHNTTIPETSTKLFRPPYGQMSPKLARTIINEKGYRVIMWSVLSKDYDARITPQQCAHNVVSKAKSGSIVVFHDSLKAATNMKVSLQATLEHFSKKGFEFKRIPE